MIQDESNKFTFEKIKEFRVCQDDPKHAIFDPKNHIQSLCIGKNFILTGTKSGDIYELELPNHLTKSNAVNLRLSCCDHDITKSICFSVHSDKIYTLTQRGMLSVWELRNMARINCKTFNRESLNLIVCKYKPRIFIAFERDIIALKDEEDFPVENSFSIHYQASIADMKISNNERIMAVALMMNAENKPKIEM